MSRLPSLSTCRLLAATKMATTISTILRTLILVALVTKMFGCAQMVNPLQKQHEIFQARTDDDWQRVWHVERHRRCFRDLLPLMGFACSRDIYRIDRRCDLCPSVSNIQKRFKAPLFAKQLPPGFLLETEAKTMLTSHVRRSKRSITDECCHGDGCSWEEYAEYCPTNRRIRT